MLGDHKLYFGLRGGLKAEGYLTHLGGTMGAFGEYLGAYNLQSKPSWTPNLELLLTDSIPQFQ